MLTDIFEPLNIFAPDDRIHLVQFQLKILGCVTFFVNFDFRSAELFLPQWRWGNVWGETLRKLIEKHCKRYNLSISNYVINFLFPIIEIADVNWGEREGEQSTIRSTFRFQKNMDDWDIQEYRNGELMPQAIEEIVKNIQNLSDLVWPGVGKI